VLGWLVGVRKRRRGAAGNGGENLGFRKAEANNRESNDLVDLGDVVRKVNVAEAGAGVIEIGEADNVLERVLPRAAARVAERLIKLGEHFGLDDVRS
jgi:hypothetical protein